jgi:hypothetical protein
MKKIKLFVQVEGSDRSELVEIAPEASLKDLADAATASGLAVPADAFVFDEENDEPLEVDKSLAQGGLKNQARVHFHRCRKIKVTVHYKAEIEDKDFPPSATVAKVHKWAAGKLLPSEIDRGEHVLQICESDIQPEPQKQIGTLVKDQTCMLCFDLVASERIEG